MTEERTQSASHIPKVIENSLSEGTIRTLTKSRNTVICCGNTRRTGVIPKGVEGLFCILKAKDQCSSAILFPNSEMN